MTRQDLERVWEGMAVRNESDSSEASTRGCRRTGYPIREGSGLISVYS